MNKSSVGFFFDALTSDYTAVIERCFPRYREMLWAALAYLPANRQYRSILELGSGTGNLTVLLAEAYPQATIRFVDVSAESLAECQSRLGTDVRFLPEQCDFRDLHYADESFDLVVSSIAIHHLAAAEKQMLFGNIRRWLKPGGLLTFADQCRGATDELYRRHIEFWKEQSLAAGSTEDEFAM